MSTPFEMDRNLYEKCVINIQVHSGEDVKFYHDNNSDSGGLVISILYFPSRSFSKYFLVYMCVSLYKTRYIQVCL